MPRNRKNPHSGVDLLAARKSLAGLPARPLDVDWLALDNVGNVAVFLGDDTSPMPSHADGTSTSTALEAIVRAVSRRAETAALERAYRAAATRAEEPIFDPPRSSPSVGSHEQGVQGYPHLVVATSDGAAVVRDLMTTFGGREVLAREAFAAVLDVLGWVSYEELHGLGACAGCRVLDDPKDPRPRAPEALARAGLYVYGFASDAWVRIVSPSTPADRADLLEMANLDAKFVALAVPFEEAAWIRLGAPPG